jgi:hypothetical protein
MEGIAGLELLARMMDRLRTDPPAALEGRGLRRTQDYWNEAVFGTIRSETDRSSRNFVQLDYDGDLHVSVRPSGTEPKIKIYAEQLFDPAPRWEGRGFDAARRDMDESTRRITLSVVDQLLHLVGVELPRAALLVSSLVSLENRIDFGSRFLPELEARLAAARPADADRLARWIDERLNAYGTDPRFLVAPGVACHWHERNLPADQQQMLRQLFVSS